MAILSPLLLWSGAALVYAAWWRRSSSGRRLLSALGWGCVLCGAALTVASAAGFGSGASEVVTHFTAATTLFAVCVPLLKRVEARPRRIRPPVVSVRQATGHGAGRLTAAAVGAPMAALLVALALPKLVPLSSDLRYLVATLLVVPAMVVAPWFALSSRSGRRAWAATGVTSLVALAVIWSATR